MSTNKENISLNTSAVKPIYGITPFTMLDYPDKTACILWFAGCNMRCSYCYNPDIVFGKGKHSFNDVLAFLNKRKNLLDGVVLSGGECTMHSGLERLLETIRSMGFLIKIDTNGSRPEKLEKLIQSNLIDYIALDFKAPSGKFGTITASDLYAEFSQTLSMLIHYKFPFEVRTTVHSELLSQNDIQEMTNTLEKFGYNGNYYLQYFRNETETIGNVSKSRNNYLQTNLLNTKLNVMTRNEG